jgi:membrane-associated protease RseP (regulator of RpoE activity)
MKNDWTQGVFAGFVAIALAVVAYGQQSTPPPATDFAPAAPGATSAAPTTETGAPAAGVSSGAEAIEKDARANEQAAETASAEPAPATSESPVPAPTARPASPLDRQLGSGTGGSSAVNGATAGQRGELGVWLVESGGPGVRVRRITEGSAAALAGLQPGDVILGINGQGANSPQAVAQLIRQMPAGETARIQFWRDGRTNELAIVLQPVRAQYEVGFRGDEPMNGIGRTSGDLESRVMRLEQQLATIMQEMRQMRQDMALHRGGASSSAIGGGAGETTTDIGATAAPGATPTGTSATDQPDATAPSSAAPTTQPEAAPAGTPTPAAEPAADSDDLFGGSPSEEPAAAAPAEGEAQPDAAPATESTSDDLFE